VLSPYLFAVYVDNVITTFEHKRLGCLYKSICVSIIMYADDIVLLSPSVTALQELLCLRRSTSKLRPFHQS